MLTKPKNETFSALPDEPLENFPQVVEGLVCVCCISIELMDSPMNLSGSIQRVQDDGTFFEELTEIRNSQLRTSWFFPHLTVCYALYELHNM